MKSNQLHEKENVPQEIMIAAILQEEPEKPRILELRDRLEAEQSMEE